MTEKIRIRRHLDGWHVVRPAFGFAASSTTVYSSGKAAIDSLISPGVASATSSTERNVAGEWVDRWNAEWIRAREDGASTATAVEIADRNTVDVLGPLNIWGD